MKKHLIVFSAALVLGSGGLALAGQPGRDAILQHYKQQAGDKAAGGFSAARGKAFFLARHSGGKPATPSCTVCHTSSPRNTGKTRAGKAIKPMAVSKTPDRFTNAKKVAKWFRRNCRSVLGRKCTPMEKGDYITFMISQ